MFRGPWNRPSVVALWVSLCMGCTLLLFCLLNMSALKERGQRSGGLSQCVSCTGSTGERQGNRAGERESSNRSDCHSQGGGDPFPPHSSAGDGGGGSHGGEEGLQPQVVHVDGHSEQWYPPRGTSLFRMGTPS